MLLKYLYYGLSQLPIRIIRLFRHLFCLDSEFKFAYKAASKFTVVLLWIAELILRIVEVLFVFDFIQILISLRASVRPLNEYDLSLSRSILGDQTYLSLIQLNNNSIYCRTNPVIAFVTGFVINYDRVISDDVLAHELIHVWQYVRVGIVYVPRALFAQKTKENYDYGGVKNLLSNIKNGKTITQYNYEQQAQIIQDFFIYYQTVNYDPLASAFNSSLHTIKKFLHQEGLMTSV